MFPPFHPNCRCTYLCVWESKGNPEKNIFFIDSTDGLKQSYVPSLFEVDNTTIPILEQELIKEQLEGFVIFTEGKPFEYAEIYDKNGISLSGIIEGEEDSIDLDWRELKKYVENGAIIVIHNHPIDFDNMHSTADLITQLKSGILISIVESYTKRFIVINTNNPLEETDELVQEIRKFEKEFYGKIDDLVDEEYDEITGGEPLFYYDEKELRKQLREKWIKFYYKDYEIGISEFFKEGTGLKLYVHDKY